MEQIDFTSITSILMWIVAGPGSAIIANQFFSWLASNSQKWVDLPSNVKFIVMLAFAPTLAVLAQYVLGYTEFLGQIQPWFQIAAVSIIGWLASQKAYANQKRVDYGRLGEDY